MRRASLWVLCALFATCSAPPPPWHDAAPAEPAARTSEWIWSSADPGRAERCRFRRDFALPSSPRAARLTISCDNHFVAWCNGDEVAAGDDWTRPVSTSLSLREGVNSLAIEGWNEGGPAALLVKLEVELDDGTRVHVVSDATWRMGAEDEVWRDLALDPADWTAAHSFGPSTAPDGPWKDVFAPAVATAAEGLEVLDGFEVELIRSAQVGEGSWVCMTFDPKGRIIVSPQWGELLRVTLTEDGADVMPLGVGLGRAQGLTCAFDSLYVNVNDKMENGGGLYRVRDLDGDDHYETVEPMFGYRSTGEHGAHAVMPGPDGKLWVLNGNMTTMPEGVVAGSPYRNYDEDLLLPRAWDPWGHASGVTAPAAQVYRMNPDGSDLELFAGGMRNPYDMAFSPSGDLFTFDADMEWDLGLPWYRPTRIVHLIAGAEYGWRSGSGKWPAHYPDSLPAVHDLGEGSPTGVEFGTGSRFPAAYQRALFACDWAYGRIFAVHLEPTAASYRATSEVFLRGEPLNVTDLEIGPDGWMYFITGGRGTQSGLYRVRYTGAPDTAAASSSTARPVRATDWDALGSSHHAERFAARVALETREVAEWAERALAESRPDAAIQSLLALARVGEPSWQGRLLDRLGEIGELDLSGRQRLDWLRVHAVCLARMGAIDPATTVGLWQRFDPLYPSGDAALDAELARLVLYLEMPDAVARTVELMERGDDLKQQFHFAFALRTATDGWNDDLLARYAAWLQQAREVQAGHSYSGYLDTIERAMADRLTVAETFEEVETAESSTDVTEEPVTFTHWTIDALSPDLDQVGSGRSFAAGKAAFTRALCAKCHRVGDEGSSMGPDLTGVAGRFGRVDLLRAILEPSADISDQYESTVIQTRDGTTVVGRVISDDGETLVVRAGPYGEERVELPSAEVVLREVSAISSMPPALVGTLSRDQLFDLLAYLEAGGDPDDERFSR